MVIAGGVTIRAGHAVGRETRVDEAWIFFEESRVVKLYPLEKLWPHVGDEHIGPGNQALDQIPALGLVDVEHDAFLAAVVEIKRRASLFLRAG